MFHVLSGNDIQQSDVYSELSLYKTTSNGGGGGGPIFGGPRILPMQMLNDNVAVAAEEPVSTADPAADPAEATAIPAEGTSAGPVEDAALEPVEDALIGPSIWWPGGGGSGSRQNFNVSFLF